ncbi:MAG: DUF1549 domain-containing protein [Planctomycetota bacterium]|jgi:hypothetical protein|nr:DUF1549 domain-containing protein [Planctomycetota bacterium]
MRLAGIFLILMPFFAEAKRPLQNLNPIDQYFESYWKAEKIKPARLTDDYEYLRRLTLDLGGRLPTPDEIRAFRANRDRDKRAKQIEQLIKEESTVQFWADQWLRILFQYRFSETDPIKVYFPSFVGWLKDSFQNDLPYNQFVTQLIADRGDYKKKPATNYILKHLTPEEPPIELTSRMTRVFLGYQIQCAQCHDHPTEDWTQENFWGITAFFGGLQSKARATFEGGVSIKLFDRGAGEMLIPDTETKITPRFLDGRAPANLKKSGTDLARFFLEYENGQFARALVNRRTQFSFSTP